MRSLDGFRARREIVEVILATWHQEADDNRAFLSKMASAYDLTVVSVPEPQKWSGNLLSQMVSLYVGLGNVPEDRYVLKTRTDVLIAADALSHVFTKDLTVDLPANLLPAGKIFDEKICVCGIEATVPFYIHDLFFFGCKRDVAKLVNMDIRYDILYRLSKEKIHLRRYVHPFIHQFPVFEKFLHVSNVLGVTDEFPVEYRYAVLDELLEIDNYVELLALYYRIVAAYFSNDWGRPDYFQWRDVPTFAGFSSEDTLTDFFHGNRHLRALMPLGDDFFTRVAAGEFAACGLGDRFAQAGEKLNHMADWRHAGDDWDMDNLISEATAAGQRAINRFEEDVRERQAAALKPQ